MKSFSPPRLASGEREMEMGWARKKGDTKYKENLIRRKERCEDFFANISLLLRLILILLLVQCKTQPNKMMFTEKQGFNNLKKTLLRALKLAMTSYTFRLQNI